MDSVTGEGHNLQHKQQLQHDGYLPLRNAVSQELVTRAIHAINARLGEGAPPEELPGWRQRSWFPDLAPQPVITDLFNASGLREIVEELLGKGNVTYSGRGQLALRFPAPPDAPHHEPGPHIDGLYTPLNGVTKGTLSSFTALVGVFLTPLERENAGNFSVWPGSHLKMQEYFRAHGLDLLLNEGKAPRLDYGQPLQLLAQPGDAVIAHYQLMHGIAQNRVHFPRYTVFFRIKHPDHDPHRYECLTNLWREWPGIRD
jgi:hypothetical protein